jgi:small GTP-binding protein
MLPRKFDFSLKVVVVGESGVGKSCFLLRFVRDTFEDTHSTLGVEFLSKIVETETHRIQLQLWDTAGQELFQSVTRGYYRGAAGALILFDIANAESFARVERWLSDIRSVARSDVVVVLIGNKSDLEAVRQVATADAAAFAQWHGMHYFEVSARTGANVAAAVNSCAATIEQNLKKTDTAQVAADRGEEISPEAEPQKRCCK